MLILLGEIPDRCILAFHHARWMSSVIYAAKMYLFRDSMGYNEETTVKLRDICLFNALMYFKNWLACPIEVDVPFNYLKLFNELQDFKVINKEISERTSRIFKNHFWYLTKEIAVFSLFSKSSDNETKNIVKKLQSYQCGELKKGAPTFPVVTKNTKIPSLIGQNSWLLFETLGVNTEWLKTPVQTWEENEDS